MCCIRPQNCTGSLLVRRYFDAYGVVSAPDRNRFIVIRLLYYRRLPSPRQENQSRSYPWIRWEPLPRPGTFTRNRHV